MMRPWRTVLTCMVFSCAVAAVCGAPHAAEPGVAPLASGSVEIDAQGSPAGVVVSAEHATHGTDFQFETVPVPASNDPATRAEFTLLDGQRDRNGGPLAVLHDGRIPTDEDQHLLVASQHPRTTGLSIVRVRRCRERLSCNAATRSTWSRLTVARRRPTNHQPPAKCLSPVSAVRGWYSPLRDPVAGNGRRCPSRKATGNCRW